MMRKELEKLDEKRMVFTGTFERRGEKPAYRGYPLPTILLKNITDSSGKIVSDHLWFNLTKAFAALILVPGDVVEFHARVREYTKGYKGRRDDVWDSPVEIDYKLSHPTKIRKIVS